MITVFGSINADLVTQVDHHPVPGETISGSDYQVLPGGKGANQALAACRSGGAVQMVGRVGKDSFAGAALTNLTADGVDLSGVVRGGTSTGVALIAVSREGENTIIVIPGANGEASASQLEPQALGEGQILITQNELDPEQTSMAHKQANASGALVIHNPAPAAPLTTEELARIDYLIVNESEALLIAASTGFETPDPLAAARHLQSLSGRGLIITLGAKGALGLRQAEEISVPAHAVDVRDTTGAGDSFVGAFAAALDRGEEFAKAIKFAVIAGSLACRSLGAQSSTPYLDEIKASLIDN